MSILNFSDYLRGLSIESSPSNQNLGSFANGADERQIKHVRVLMHFDGAFNTEKLALAITDSLTAPTVTYTSDDINVRDIDDSVTTDVNDYLGWIRFDFNKEWLHASTTYYLYMTSLNYTESTTKSINMIFDYPIPIYGTRLSSAQLHPIAMQIFCLEEY